MTPVRAVAYVGGALLLAAWLAAAAGVSRQARTMRILSPQPADVALDAVATNVQSQALRLRQRLAVAPAPQTPLRNPFGFAVRETARPRVAARVESAPPTVVPDPPAVAPGLSLLGVAEQHTAAGVIRTAMIGGEDDQLFMAIEGQDIAGRYRVTAVSAGAVELKDLSTGATRRLILK